MAVLSELPHHGRLNPGNHRRRERNLTIEREALKLEILEAALAAKASKGKVIVQVERVAANGFLKAKDVVIPGELVDAVVVAEEPSKFHRQTGATIYNPFLSGEVRSPRGAAASPKTELKAADIVCRRAGDELYPGARVTVGVGRGSGGGREAEIEGIVDHVTSLWSSAPSAERRSPPNFGSTANATAYLSHPTMFDFYHAAAWISLFWARPRWTRTAT
jgi:propionate CoA-transferase